MSPGRTRESYLDVAFGVGASALFLTLWPVGGPGPKYGEWIGTLFVAWSIGLVGVIVSVLRPRLLLNPLLYPGLWLMGYAVNWGQVASLYGYDYFCGRAFRAAGERAGIMFVVLPAVNGVSHGARQPYLAGEPPPDPASPEEEP